MLYIVPQDDGLYRLESDDGIIGTDYTEEEVKEFVKEMEAIQ